MKVEHPDNDSRCLPRRRNPLGCRVTVDPSAAPGAHAPPARSAAPREPVQVEWAERDRVIPFEHFGRPLMERVPGAELVRVAGIGHVPMFDDPDAVARLILDVTGAVDRSATPG